MASSSANFCRKRDHSTESVELGFKLLPIATPAKLANPHRFRKSVFSPAFRSNPFPIAAPAVSPSRHLLKLSNESVAFSVVMAVAEFMVVGQALCNESIPFSVVT
jgi:hypothetical protein